MMKLGVSKTCKTADLVVLPLYDDKKLPKESAFLGKDVIKHVEHLIKRGDFKGGLFETLSIPTLSKAFSSVLLVGLGKKKEIARDQYREAGAVAKSAAISAKISSLVVVCPFSEKDIQRALVEGVCMGGYKFEAYLTDKKAHLHKVKSCVFVGSISASDVKRSQALSQAMHYVRDLGNAPAIDMDPQALGKEAKKLAGGSIKVKVLGKKEIVKLKMGALLGVNAGSDKDPCVAILEYKHQPKKKGGPICLAGKGITFDAGGLNIKPTGYMMEMKMDMLGAGTVLGVFKALKALKPKAHVVGLIGCTENLLGGSAYKPSDILKSYSGKTIEVHNTDAEGRLVLADVLAYASKNYKPRYLIDMATLTGACLHALGSDVCALMGNDQKLIGKLLDASKDTDEMLWELPMPKHYREAVKGSISDVRNLSKEMYAGTIMAGAFLGSFVGKTTWAHLDIAGTGMVKKPAFKYLTEGATGRQVRTLYRFIEMEG